MALIQGLPKHPERPENLIKNLEANQSRDYVAVFECGWLYLIKEKEEEGGGGGGGGGGGESNGKKGKSWSNDF